MARDSCVLQMCHVTLFRGRKVILSDLSWRVEAGEHWAVVGPNGSGKTSMLRTALGYLWPSEGSVTVLGRRFGEVDLRRLRPQVGWVSAALHDWVRPGETALRVVLSGRFGTVGLFDRPAPEDRQRAAALLADLGCRELADLPFGVLSQGEQQKVMIARALLADANVLILDEPCAGMDLSARESLLETVERLARRADAPTLILVTHHIEEITPAFTHALVLKDGRAIAQGPKRDVLVDGVLSRAFDLPVRLDTADGRFWPRLCRRAADGWRPPAPPAAGP